MNLSKKEKFRLNTINQIEEQYRKIWIEEAIVNNVDNDNLIDWIAKTFDVELSQISHSYINTLHKQTKILNTAKKYRKVKEETQNEEELDPRFQKMAQEIDELKEEIRVLKKLYFEK